MFDLENAITLHAMLGNLASSRSNGAVYGISRVVSGTWGIFSSDGGDVHSNLEFVQRIQDT